MSGHEFSYYFDEVADGGDDVSQGGDEYGWPEDSPEERWAAWYRNECMEDWYGSDQRPENNGVYTRIQRDAAPRERTPQRLPDY